MITEALCHVPGFFENREHIAAFYQAGRESLTYLTAFSSSSCVPAASVSSQITFTDPTINTQPNKMSVYGI